jgi:flagellar hook-associated protein 1 FlgK
MTFGKGELQSFLNVLNGSGPNPLNEMDTRDRGLPFYKDKLDAFAQTLADVFNNIVPAVDDTVTPPVDKTDEFGNTIYRNFFGEMTADGTVITFDKVSAKNISISNALKSDSSYLIYDKNSTVNDYTVKMLDELITKEHKFDTASDDYTGTFEDYITDFNVALGNDISFSNTNFQASAIITQEILNSRDSVMGVTETEETANMLVFNRAFQAAARMMNTMDGMLDLIVNRLGIG